MPAGPSTVFVSRAREDSDFALRLGQELRDANSFPTDLLTRTQMRNIQFITAYEKRLEGTPAR